MSVRCSQVLQQALAGSEPGELLQVLRSVRPDSSQQDKAPSGSWSRACITAVLPGAVTLLHKLLDPSSVASLTPDQLQVMFCYEAIRGPGKLSMRCHLSRQCVLNIVVN